VVWRSSDDGKSWQPIDFVGSGERAPPRTAARVVLPHPEAPDQIVVLSATCEDQARGVWGGDLYVTHDGGASWNRMPLPSELEEFYDVSLGAQIEDVWTSNAHPGGLLIEFDRVVWLTTDAGESWRQVKAEAVEDAVGRRGAPSPIQVDDTAFVPTADGLFRVGVSESNESSAEEVFPSDHWLAWYAEQFVARSYRRGFSEWDVGTSGLDVVVHCPSGMDACPEPHWTFSLSSSGDLSWTDAEERLESLGTPTIPPLKCDPSSHCCHARSAGSDASSGAPLVVAQVCFEPMLYRLAIRSLELSAADDVDAIPWGDE